MSITLEDLRAGGVIGALDERFARAMGRLGDETDSRVLIAAAMVSRYVGHGHVCLDPPRLVEIPTQLRAVTDDDDRVAELTRGDWPNMLEWYSILTGCALVKGSGSPLVVDDRGRLYLRRYYEHQMRLADAILARAEHVEAVADEALLTVGLDRLFPPGTLVGPDLQRAAAENALRRRFCVVSGGPGTGKTSTVVKILALLIEQALGAGTPVPRMHLVAPTGKAAARLVESIERARDALLCDEAVKQEMPTEASTIHRLLGVTRRSASEFVHHALRPLITDLVLVDEASMVDLGLMARLFDAIPETARVILLGDRDQLASVEAGAVLGDICNTGRRKDEKRARPDAAVRACITHLTHSYRYSAEGAIGRLASAINRQDVELTFALLADPALPDIRLEAPSSGRELSPALRDAVVAGYRPTLEAPTAAERLVAFDRFRVLCAHRRGRFGIETLNPLITHALAVAGLVPGGAPGHYPGRPIIVTRNDYLVRLFNGDVGVVLSAEGGGHRAHFLTADGETRDVAASRLPPHETVWAMSVHKSQGSEMDEVAVVLPAELSRALSRELLYTAVTRARHRVVIHADKAILRAAIERDVERASGLRDALWT